jgi:hypothetical protein
LLTDKSSTAKAEKTSVKQPALVKEVFIEEITTPPVKSETKETSAKPAEVKDAPTKPSTVTSSAKTLETNAITSQNGDTLKARAADGHLTADTASMPDQSPAGKKAAEKPTTEKVPGKKSPPVL